MTVDTTANHKPVTWIIGATGGIGAALARRLAPRTQLVLSARNEAPLTALANELGAHDITVDATQPESIQQALTNVLQIYGRIDAVVLAVGSILLKSAHRTSLDEWHATITQNLHAAFYVMRAVTETVYNPALAITIVPLILRIPPWVAVVPIRRLPYLGRWH
jgi:NADP-dependent 3-hydroxy acid dehydrogenase YdfG